jgi:hypothetical protein
VFRTTAVAPKSLRRTSPVTWPRPENASAATPKPCDGADTPLAAWAAAVPVLATTVAPTTRATRVPLPEKIRVVTQLNCR